MIDFKVGDIVKPKFNIVYTPPIVISVKRRYKVTKIMGDRFHIDGIDDNTTWIEYTIDFELKEK